MHRATFVVYPGFALVDTAGLASAFNGANRVLSQAGKPAFYNVALASAYGGSVESSSGVAVELSAPVQDELFALMGLLKQYGPKLGRPHADTLNDSEHANMKELRFKADGGVWRVTYAFDPKREAILPAAGDKSGVSEKRFSKQRTIAIRRSLCRTD